MASDYALLAIHDVVAACARGDDGAWDEFVARTQPVIARACFRAAAGWAQRGPAVIEDLVQETYTKLISGRLLESFEPRHPDAVYGFLKLVASRVAHDHCKAQDAAKRGRGTREVSFDLVEVGSASMPGPEGQVLLQQIEACVSELSSGREVDRDLLIFQLYYRVGLSAAAIASIPSLDLSAKGVESFLNRLTHLVRAKLVEGEERKKAAHGVS